MWDTLSTRSRQKRASVLSRHHSALPVRLCRVFPRSSGNDSSDPQLNTSGQFSEREKWEALHCKCVFTSNATIERIGSMNVIFHSHRCHVIARSFRTCEAARSPEPSACGSLASSSWAVIGLRLRSANDRHLWHTLMRESATGHNCYCLEV